jgi:hypothetical protein
LIDWWQLFFYNIEKKFNQEISLLFWFLIYQFVIRTNIYVYDNKNCCFLIELKFYSMTYVSSMSISSSDYTFWRMNETRSSSYDYPSRKDNKELLIYNLSFINLSSDYTHQNNTKKIIISIILIIFIQSFHSQGFILFPLLSVVGTEFISIFNETTHIFFFNICIFISRWHSFRIAEA